MHQLSVRIIVWPESHANFVWPLDVIFISSCFPVFPMTYKSSYAKMKTKILYTICVSSFHQCLTSVLLTKRPVLFSFLTAFEMCINYPAQNRLWKWGCRVRFQLSNIQSQVCCWNILSSRFFLLFSLYGSFQEFISL